MSFPSWLIYQLATSDDMRPNCPVDWTNRTLVLNNSFRAIWRIFSREQNHVQNHEHMFGTDGKK